MDLEYIYKEMLAERESRAEHEGTILGTCQEYCPKFEYIERMIRGDISKYEKDVVFKKYYRSSAGKSKSFPEDVRPVSLLLEATNYLIELSYNDFSMEMYKFIENRTRAIRMDLSLQESSCKSAIKILEKIARFHIAYNYALFDNKDFEAHLNQDQLKKILLTLEDLYTKKQEINEEFVSYILLLSIDGKYPQLEQYLYCPKVKQAYNIRKYYQQGNIYRYFCECRKLDLLSFSVSLMSFDKVRMKAIEFYGKSLVERIDISFFKELFYTSEAETKSIFSKMNIEIISNKADFKDLDIFETEDFVLKERKEMIGLESFSVLIYLGDIESKIAKLVFRNYISKFIKQNLNKTVNIRSLGSQNREEFIFYTIIDRICQKYTALIYQNLRKLLETKQNKKQIIKTMCYSVLKSYLKNLALKYTEKHLAKHLLKQKLTEWRKKCTGQVQLNFSEPEKIEEGPGIAFVLNDSIYSVILKNSTEKSNIKEPVFFNYKEVLPQRLLKFRLVVFSVDKSARREIEEKFFMMNKIIDTPQNLMKMFDAIEETAKKCKCIKRVKIMNILKNKNKNKQIYIVTHLIENKRNSRELEDILVNLHNNKTFKNIDVYYEDGEEMTFL
ncbi:SAC3 family protein 2 [Nosema granulosis]|uniref:SAC3 family protein 2 n=1 Tax=Nosema granulosis TaxID=83296 RepID=A0A9P6KZS0_9MICR|nr:SAC3 family protein 2 [Nosema granulosis]